MEQQGTQGQPGRPLPPAWIGYRLLAWAVLLLGLLATGFGWWRSAEQLQQASDTALDELAAHSAGLIEERLGRYVDLLTSFQALFRGNGLATRRAFHEHFAAMDVHARFPGVLAVSFAPRVAEQERAAFEAGVQADRSLRSAGYPEYRIFPPGRRADYLPVSYLEPMVGNEAVFGADLWLADTDRRATERARDKGQAQLSRPRRLLQGELGLTLRLPVYRAAAWPQDETRRRALHAGQVTGVFKARNLMREVLPQALGHYRVRITDIGAIEDDGEAAGGPVLLYDNVSPGADFDPAEADVREHVLALNGRLWSVQLARPAADVRWLPLPLAILGSGALASLAAFAVLAGFASRYQRAARLAEALGREARQSALRLKTVIDSTADGIVTLDARHVVSSVNPAFLRLLGATEGQVLGRALGLFLQDGEGLPVDTPALVGGVHEARLGLPGGTQAITVDVSFSDMALDGERQVVAILRDASQRRRVEQQIRHLAHHDALTGLPNRMLLQDRLQQAFERARRDGRAAALLFVDLDHFKAVNDSLGHDMGDAVLREVARRLRDTVRAGDTVARLGGDEFVVLLATLQDPDDCRRVADQILRALGRPVSLGVHSVRITPSIGGALVSEALDSPAEWMRQADAAMYQAKLQGRNAFCCSEPALPAEAAAPSCA
ncbi:sensor domain-containing diguanylate cyclase [Eleftheria terrae]|uniref:sensor domain-containing diguanylate cyclase n=1 Tax=Eleftheria terrae TaxID=1597781 RepID=UPI00263B4F5F|nr:diguanylate cyclase [Eleftheria terrae]WKB52183.1 diguanylate cyclase [Eleftheria terrae]